MSPQKSQLEKLLARWEARWRFRQIVLYLPRIVLAALLVGIAATVVVGTLRLLPPAETALLNGILIGLVLALLIGALRLWGQHGLAAAQHFDRLFHLQERMATALELLDGRIQTVPEMSEHQLADAYQRASDVDPRKAIQLRVRWLEWIPVPFLGLVLGVLLAFYAVSYSQAGSLSPGSQAAVSGAAEQVRDITEDVATDSGLTDDERESLLESLEVSLDALEAPDVSAQDAYVEMSNLESELQEQADAIRQENTDQQAALDDASEAMGADSPQQLGESLEELEGDVTEMDAQEREAAASGLEEAAELTEEHLPELAERFEEAAEALRNGDDAAAEQALDDAQQGITEQQAQQAQREATAQNLESAAQDASSSADQVAQSESEAGSGQPNQLPEGAPQTAGLEEGQGGQSDTGQPSDTGGSPVQSEAEDAPPAAGGEGDGEPSDESASGGSSDDPDSQDPGEGGQSDEARDEGGGSGTGENTGQDSSGGASETELGSSDSDGTGETEYDPVFAPEGGEGEGSGAIFLEPDASDETTLEGDFQENPAGSSTVPYNEVYGNYAEAANRALESDYVPLGMRDVVRDYFTSLEPEEQP